MQVSNDSFVAAVPEALAPTSSPPPTQHEILVPIDFSDASVTALRCARALAEGRKMQVILLNVVEEPGSFRTLDMVARRRAGCAQRAQQLHQLAHREFRQSESRFAKASQPLRSLAGRARAGWS